MREPGRLLEISWDGFDGNLRKEMDWFWRDQSTLTDVTIFCDGGSVRAHKLILAMNSPYFHNMSIETRNGCGNSVISLRGVDIHDFKLLLEYMYRGKVFVGESSVKRVVELAKSLYVRGFGDDAHYPKARQRNGSVTSVYADSDGENDQFEPPVCYIRPEEIVMDTTSNRVTRASLATQSCSRGRKLSEANHDGEKRSRSPIKRYRLVSERRTSEKAPTRETTSASQGPQATFEREEPEGRSESSMAALGAEKTPGLQRKSCDLGADTVVALEGHEEKHGPEVELDDGQSARLSGLFLCDICGFIAGNPGALANHKNRHKPDRSQASPSGSLMDLDVNQRLASSSEHFKIIYDCPRCIKISFRTPNIMLRHFLKRHNGESIQPVVRVVCASCEHSFSSGDGVVEYIKHISEMHSIDVAADLCTEVKTEPETNGHVLNGSADQQLIETASNADTERASSRGSCAGIKRLRISHDDEATIEDADLSKVKKEMETGGELEGVFKKCSECSYTTSQNRFLRRHMIACHSNGSNEDQFLCKFCNFSTPNRSTIKSHLVSTHRDTTTKVKECYRNNQKIDEILDDQAANASTQLPKRKSNVKSGTVGQVKRGRPSLAGSAGRPAKIGSTSPKGRIRVALRLKKAAIAKQRRKTDGMIDNMEEKRSEAMEASRASLDGDLPKKHPRVSSPRAGRYATMSKVSLKCPDCTYVAKSDAMFERHAFLHRSCDETKLALCEVCGVVKKKGSMNYHMKKHDTEAKETNGQAQQSAPKQQQ